MVDLLQCISLLHYVGFNYGCPHWFQRHSPIAHLCFADAHDAGFRECDSLGGVFPNSNPLPGYLHLASVTHNRCFS